MFAFANTDTALMRTKLAPSASFTSHLLVGVLHKREGAYDRAMEHLQRALAFSPHDSAVLGHLAEIHEIQGRYPLAVETYMRAIQATPSFDEGYNNIGVIYLKQGKRDSAREFFKRAHRLRPDNPTYKRNYELTLIPAWKK